MSKDVSIKTIAEEAGYSASTVSRVMNGHAREFRISKRTEELILKTAKKFDYEANPVAVNLRVKKSLTIGLIIPSFNNPFFVNITGILNKELAQRGYNIIITESNEDPETEEKMIKQLLSRSVDGLLIIPCRDRDINLKLLEDTLNDGVPVMCIDRYIKNSSIPYITTDNVNGAYKGVKLLLEKGHKKVACIQGIENSTASEDRKEGYYMALKENNIEPFYIGGDEFSIMCGYREGKVLLQYKEKPTAIFAMSNTIALGVMKAATEGGYKIPEDFSLISFDDNVFLDYLSTPLTAISQPKEEISQIAARVLINHIDGKMDLSDWQSEFLMPKIVYRKSIKRL
jgi:LacI family transcriptional regulator